MKKLLVVYFLILSNVCAFAQQSYIFEKNEKFGVKDSKDKTIVKPVYDYVYTLGDKFFLVEKDRKIGLVRQDGKVILNTIYDDIREFGDNAFMIMENGKWGITNQYNKEILSTEYSGFEQLNDFLYVIKAGNKKGLINIYGDVIKFPFYDEIKEFSDNLFLVKNGSNVGLMDDFGNVIIPDKYNSLEKLPVPNLYRIGMGDKYGVMDTSGKVIVEPVLEEIDCSDERYITVKKDGKYGFIINKQYVPAIYDKIVYTQDEFGVIVVKKGDLTGFVTVYGLVIPPIYDNISRFSPNGYAFVEKRGTLMFVDITGKERTLQDVTGRGKRQ